MASYSYPNGCFEITTHIKDGFKRFHNCRAQYSKFVLNDDDNIPRFIVYQFISYATPVIQIVRDMKYDKYIVSCNENPFGYSPTTSRQISRWLHEIVTPIDSYTIRHAYDVARPITPDIATYHYDNVTIDFHSSFTFHNVWR